MAVLSLWMNESRHLDASQARPKLRDEMVESELITMAQTGDAYAFEELVRRFRNDVFALAFHFMREREEAWDISQEVFIKAHRALKRFRGDDSFKPWLLRITSNQCKDQWKKRRIKTVSYDDALESADAPSGIPGPASEAEAREIGEAILDALDTLPHKHRTAFVLREFEGMSYEEMAEAMNCNIGTVMSRLHHARKKLRDYLTRRGLMQGQEQGRE